MLLSFYVEMYELKISSMASVSVSGSVSVPGTCIIVSMGLR